MKSLFIVQIKDFKGLEKYILPYFIDYQNISDICIFHFTSQDNTKKARKLDYYLFSISRLWKNPREKIDTGLPSLICSQKQLNTNRPANCVPYLSQNFPDFAYQDTSTNCLLRLGFLPEPSRRKNKDKFENIRVIGKKWKILLEKTMT